jgi:hypothetical protein
MKYIKNFDELLIESYEKPKASMELLKHLRNGEAILVKKEDLDKFYDTLGYYIWLDFTKHDPELMGDITFFVLIGNKVYHSHKPSFGGQEFKIYKPTWKDLKIYRDI